MKSKIIIGATLFIIFSVILSLSFAPKRVLPVNAVGVHYVGAETGRIALTNTTSKRLLVQFLAVELCQTNEWADGRLAMAPETIPPHETISIRVNPVPSGEPWRLKMFVAEELTGGDWLMRATRNYVRNRYEQLHGRPTRVPYKINEFSTNVTYYGHETKLLSPVLE